MEAKILVNQIKCLECGDTPYSAHRHDFKYCKCGAVAVDGGMDYLRRVGELSSIYDMSVVIDQKLYEALKGAVKWARETQRNDFGTVCAIVRAIRDEGYSIQERLVEWKK